MDEARASLEALGLEADEALLEVCWRRVEERILNECNLSKVPEGLRHCAAGMTLAEYLAYLRLTGGLEETALHVEPLMKQLQEGDTSVTWQLDGAATKDQLLDRLIDGLRGQAGQLVRYRRLQW